MSAEPLLGVRDLVVEFPHRDGTVRALDGVSLDIAPGELLGLVGESGAGKSLAGAALLGLLPPPGRVAGGEMRFDGRRLDTLDAAGWRALRGRHIGAVFQDPLTALDPLQTLGAQLVETIRTHLPLDAAAARTRAIELLAATGLPSPEQRLAQYPHQLSGGQRQRAVIALALAGEPRLLVADEPTTALDVATQAQVMAVLRRLAGERGLAVLLVTHDLGLVAQHCRRVAVLYAGRVVESGPSAALIARPAHPYTAGLLAALPTLDGPPAERLAQIPGAMPRPGAWPAGCAFHPRCAQAGPRCRAQRPPLRAVGATQAACWLHDGGVG